VIASVISPPRRVSNEHRPAREEPDAMKREAYRYAFEPSARMKDVEEALLLAMLAVESLYGQSRVRMDAAYRVSAQQRACVIDAATQVGRDICRIFTGFLIREFGEGAFQVRRADGVPASARSQEVRA
jgi:hypothetical protein